MLQQPLLYLFQFFLHPKQPKNQLLHCLVLFLVYQFLLYLVIRRLKFMKAKEFDKIFDDNKEDIKVS